MDGLKARDAITMTGIIVTIVGTGVRAIVASATMVRIVVVKAIVASATLARIVVVKAIVASAVARVTMETTVSIVVVVKKSKLSFLHVLLWGQALSTLAPLYYVHQWFMSI
jgi:hypothetical protein